MFAVSQQLLRVQPRPTGLGEGIVRRFAAEGCRVVIGDINKERGESIADELGQAACFVETDTTSETSWHYSVAETLRTFGRLDILVNNAGSGNGINRIDHEPPEKFERLMRLNVTGYWNGIRAAVAPMRTQGAGSIINMGSIDSFIGVAGLASYVASKFAVLGLTKSAALEFGHMGIRVNSINPGVIQTPGLGKASPRMVEELQQAVLRQPIKRFGTPDEVAYAALYFASDESSYCTGSALVIDGGHIAGRHRDLED